MLSSQIECLLTTCFSGFITSVTAFIPSITFKLFWDATIVGTSELANLTSWISCCYKTQQTDQQQNDRLFSTPTVSLNTVPLKSLWIEILY